MGLFSKNPPAHAAPLVLLLSFFLAQVSLAETLTPEFRLLELEREYRSDTPDPGKQEGRRKLFALAEARFDNRLGTADELFVLLDRPALDEAADWLALVYRAKLNESANAPALERRLRDAFSGRQFFAVFDSDRRWRWHSPLGHRFEFLETVDRLDIYRDDILFFTLQLG